MLISTLGKRLLFWQHFLLKSHLQLFRNKLYLYIRNPLISLWAKEYIEILIFLALGFGFYRQGSMCITICERTVPLVCGAVFLENKVKAAARWSGCCSGAQSAASAVSATQRTHQPTVCTPLENVQWCSVSCPPSPRRRRAFGRFSSQVELRARRANAKAHIPSRILIRGSRRVLLLDSFFCVHILRESSFSRVIAKSSTCKHVVKFGRHNIKIARKLLT